MIHLAFVSHYLIMKHLKNFIALIFCIVFFAFVSLTTFGQNLSGLRTQHQKLLANQTKITERIDWRLNKDRFKKELESELFNMDWDNEQINPYSSDPIIGEKIDIREYVNPVKTKVVNSHFGYRPSFGRNHYGDDLRAGMMDTVYAAFSGKVRLTKFDRSGYGFFIMIRHENKLETLYGHLSRFLVKENQYVKAGEPIGLSGNTGRSTGPHLHFEFRYNGKCINPEKLVDFTTHTPLVGIYTYSHETVSKPKTVASTKTVRKHKRRR